MAVQTTDTVIRVVDVPFSDRSIGYDLIIKQDGQAIRLPLTGLGRMAAHEAAAAVVAALETYTLESVRLLD